MRNCLFLCWIALAAHANEHPPRYEGIGIYGKPTSEIANSTINVWMYLPHDPIIVEAGGFEGENAKEVAERYPYGRVIVFEPNPRAFKTLLQNVEGLPNVTAINAALHSVRGMAPLHLNHGVYGNDIRLEPWSSLLDGFCFGGDVFNCFKGPSVEVSCVVLDEWCKENQIDHIDFLHLDTEGSELQILKSSLEILKTVAVVHTKTNLSQFRKGTTQYRELKQFLEEHGFALISHWYLEGLQGEATFVQRRIYDSIFN
ncbi:MAG TPA: FkbM family methyltransferase [Chlamydiales bacterium]|nr:FkbM family methyltransferase [Chlamydiales bacterium]